MWLLNALMSPVYRIAALLGAVLVAIGAIYAKGRSDANARNTLRNYKETQDAIERSISARRAADQRNVGERLRDDDGFRRD